MRTQIQTWQIIEGRLQKIETSFAQAWRTHPIYLETWFESSPEMIGPGLGIIGHHVQTSSSPLNLLGIDQSGSTVIVELTSDTLSREALAQAIDHASDIATWSIEEIGEICTKHTGKSLEDYITDVFPTINPEGMIINKTQRIILIGFGIESSLERMITWLSKAYSVDIIAMMFHYVKTRSGDELLMKTSVISERVMPEEVLKQHSKNGNVSVEPGRNELEEIRRLVKNFR